MCEVIERKPVFISQYLMLKDLLDEKDPKQVNSAIVYLYARIENLKLELKERGILFDEGARIRSRYSNFKPYKLLQTSQNIEFAKRVLKEIESDSILEFIAERANDGR